MNKTHYFLIIFFLMVSLLYGSEFNHYAIFKINSLQVGKLEGMIGWQAAGPGGYPGPASFYISIKNEIYIPDRVNSRINIYDNNFRFLRTCYEKGEKFAHFASDLKVDSMGNMYYSFPELGLVKIDKNGKRVYLISPEKLSWEVTSNANYFPIDDYIYIYTTDKNIKYISSDGKIYSNKEALQKNKIPTNKKMEATKKSFQKFNMLSSEMMSNSQKTEQSIPLSSDPNNIIINDRFYSTDFRQSKKYFNKINSKKENIEQPNFSISIVNTKRELLKESKILKKEIDIDLDKIDPTFIGYDNEHNSYWQRSKRETPNYLIYSIIILSKYGNILDSFIFGESRRNKKLGLYSDYTNYPTTGAKIAIAPNGDVYFLQGNKNEYSLYKVKRQW